MEETHNLVNNSWNKYYMLALFKEIPIALKLKR